jgi:hypothetical protein
MVRKYSEELVNRRGISPGTALKSRARFTAAVRASFVPDSL